MEAAFNTELKMTKAERLNTGESSLTHAMVFTGVHIDPDTGMPVRYRVENSWSDKACDKGFLVMTDKWFTEYVFQIVSRLAARRWRWCADDDTRLHRAHSSRASF